jgi:hypothetical protein
MIRPYTDEELRRWNKGEYQVQLDLPGRPRPMGYCDGTAEDEAALVAMSEEEGEYALEIHKRVLRTGRQIWTLRTTANQGDAPVDDD